jgi:hypothetical protein
VGRQDAIPVGEPTARLDGETCEWCPDPATVATEIKRKLRGQRNAVVGTGSYIYTCNEHERLAENVVAEKAQVAK